MPLIVRIVIGAAGVYVLVLAIGIPLRRYSDRWHNRNDWYRRAVRQARRDHKARPWRRVSPATIPFHPDLPPERSIVN